MRQLTVFRTIAFILIVFTVWSPSAFAGRKTNQRVQGRNNLQDIQSYRKQKELNQKQLKVQAEIKSNFQTELDKIAEVKTRPVRLPKDKFGQFAYTVGIIALAFQIADTVAIGVESTYAS